MKIVLALLITLGSYFTNYAQQNNLRKGDWEVNLILNENNSLPFSISVKKNAITVINGEEEILLNDPLSKNDSLVYRFPYFNSELILQTISREEFKGYWFNYNKGSDYKIPVHGKFAKKQRNKKTETTTNFDGKWEVKFAEETNHAYPAIGLFNQKESKLNISGTFLTETGDYRFLAGKVLGDSMYMSCFDGSHAFLFTGTIDEGKIIGKFYSGNHYSSGWKAHRNDNFELTDPEKITFVEKGKTFSFEVRDTSNRVFSYPNENLKGKVVIVQIMGTWCPNCLDESLYFKELQKKYGKENLEILSVCYEVGDSFEEYVHAIRKLQQKLNTDFTYLIGGNASKNKALEDFNSLNNISSFPTAIIIDKNGEVVKIHTGFSGPATGEIYNLYTESMENLTKELIAK